MAEDWSLRGLRIARRLVATAVGIALLGLLATELTRARPALTLSGGDASGRRHALADLLATHAEDAGADVTVVPTDGSLDALDRIMAGTLDAALVQGGLGNRAGVAQVASLGVEPLQLVVAPDVVPGPDLSGLAGREVNLSARGTGTREVATRVLDFAGLGADAGLHPHGLSYRALDVLDESGLPEATFVTSVVPSPTVSRLVDEHGWRLAPVPFVDALALRDIALLRVTIPAGAYGVRPAVPEEPLVTVGTRLLLVARADLPKRHVRRLLDAMFDGRFFADAALPRVAEADVADAAEYTVHPGTRAWLGRNEPLVTSGDLEGLESLRSLLASAGFAAWLLWRWLRKRRFAGFEHFIDAVTAIEKEALEHERAEVIDLDAVIELRARLAELKSDALHRYTARQLQGEEAMGTFLAHVSDARSFLDGMILHERDRREEEAREATSRQVSERIARALEDPGDPA